MASVSSATLLGVTGFPVCVECHVSSGIPGFALVGLPDASVREARDRVRAALLSSKLPWPLQRVTVNLAPTGLPKAGAALDLAIAMGLLIAQEVVDPASVAHMAFLGELGLDGSIRPVPGILPMVDEVEQPVVVVPLANRCEAELVAGKEVRGVESLGDLVAALAGNAPWPEGGPPPRPAPPGGFADLGDVRGHPVARLALEVAAAGEHHLFMSGPPGAGKTMLARRLPGLLPSLSPEVALEATKVHSAAGERLAGEGLLTMPPFRAPHHSASLVSLVGGGTSVMRPGEISLAHGGVLFLDELGEFPAHVLDALRQPLEEGRVRVSRAAASVEYPASCLLVGAMNPCPCGSANPSQCRCGDMALAKYARRVSGPLLDRFDLRIRVVPPGSGDLLSDQRGESSEAVKARVAAARERAADRGVVANRFLDPDALGKCAPLSPGARDVLTAEISAGRLSGRGLHRVWRVAVTLSDLAREPVPLTEASVRQALALRADLTPRPARAQ